MECLGNRQPDPRAGAGDEGGFVADVEMDHGVHPAGFAAAGGEAMAVGVDISQPDQVAAMIARAIAAYGDLDGAFNNAGINGAQAGARGKRTAERSVEEFDRLLAVNLRGTWLCLRAEIEHMAARGAGAIVSTASLAALTGFPTTAGYAASKHGIVGLTKTAAIEYGPALRINCICPGWITTDMTAATITQRGEALLARVPLRTFGTPEDIGEMACWLLSDRARFVTGGAFIVDGGYMAS